MEGEVWGEGHGFQYPVCWARVCMVRQPVQVGAWGMRVSQVGSWVGGIICGLLC